MILILRVKLFNVITKHSSVHGFNTPRTQLNIMSSNTNEINRYVVTFSGICVFPECNTLENSTKGLGV